MSLYASEFLASFSNDEVKEINLESGSIKKKIFIRRLSHKVGSMYRLKCQQMTSRTEFDAVINAGKANPLFFQEDIEVGSFYLLRKSLCDPIGKLIFSDDNSEAFEAFADTIADEVANDIVYEILTFNHIIEFKKKA